MTLKSRWFKDQIGTVRFTTEKGSKRFVTVEDSKTRTAYGFFMGDQYLHAGNTIKFDGMAKIKTEVIKRKRIEEKARYYHDPLDGSSNLGWSYYELTNVTYDVMEDEDIKTKLRSISEQLNDCSRDWNRSNPVVLIMTLNGMQEASKMIQNKLNKVTVMKLIDVSDLIKSIED